MTKIPRNPNDIPLNVNMSKEDYAEAKVRRLDIMIENETNPDTVSRYESLKTEFFKALPKRKIRKKKDEKHRELESTERALGELSANEKILKKPEAIRREKELEALKKKREAILREMMEIDKAMDDAKDDDEDVECPVCGDRLKNPEHPSHVNSARHQAALKLQETSRSDGD
jgi:hypothetical protein